MQGSAGGCAIFDSFILGSIFLSRDRCSFNPLESGMDGFLSYYVSRALNLGCYNHEHSGTETVEMTLFC